MAAVIEQLVREYPALARLGQAAQRNPQGTAVEYFGELAAAKASGNTARINSVLSAGGVRS